MCVIFFLFLTLFLFLGETTPYIKELLRHAEELFVFAKTFRRKYQVSIKEAKRYYESTSYKDELVWAAAWLYRATGKKEYLKWVSTTQNNFDQLSISPDK